MYGVLLQYPRSLIPFVFSKSRNLSANAKLLCYRALPRKARRTFSARQLEAYWLRHVELLPLELFAQCLLLSSLFNTYKPGCNAAIPSSVWATQNLEKKKRSLLLEIPCDGELRFSHQFSWKYRVLVHDGMSVCKQFFQKRCLPAATVSS